jgi:hypothetical protein
VTEVEAVAAVLQGLERANIPAMLVGSLSSNAYGIERSTKDADFVVQLGSLPLSRLLRELPEGFILEPQIGFETITSSTRYRLRYEPLAFLIEIFEVTDDPHDQLRFQNRRETTFGGVRAFLPRPEDVIITKLRWSKGGRRSKDIDDVQNVLSVQQGHLDLPYIRHWCAQYDTLDLFEKTLASIPPLP